MCHQSLCWKGLDDLILSRKLKDGKEWPGGRMGKKSLDKRKRDVRRAVEDVKFCVERGSKGERQESGGGKHPRALRSFQGRREVTKDGEELEGDASVHPWTDPPEPARVNPLPRAAPGKTDHDARQNCVRSKSRSQAGSGRPPCEHVHQNLDGYAGHSGLPSTPS